MIRRFLPLGSLLGVMLSAVFCYAQSTDPVVFDDDFGYDVFYQPFTDTSPGAVSIVSTQVYQGTTALAVSVPYPGGAFDYAGGAFASESPRDLSGYNALTFWAVASDPAILDAAGIGIDTRGDSPYQATLRNIPLSSSWSKVVIPIPLGDKLTSEQGLFFFAEGGGDILGTNLWIDEVRYENLSTVTNPQPYILSAIEKTFVGAAFTPRDLGVLFDVDGTATDVACKPGYFTFFTSHSGVAAVNGGIIEMVGTGSASITASLGSVAATGTIAVEVHASPTEPAPLPVRPWPEVLSLFSDSYADLRNPTWSTGWDVADVTEIDIAGNAVKAYSNLAFAAIDFSGHPVDATGGTHLNMDVWLPGGTVLRVKLVDWGADGAYGGGDDSDHELVFHSLGDPPLETQTWVRLEMPLADFTQLNGVEHLAQILLSGDSEVLFVDNVLFSGPSLAAADEPVVRAGARIVSASPNPFNPRTEIAYEVRRPGPITLRIVDIAGRTVRKFLRNPDAPGRHFVTWDGQDTNGLRVASGVYLVQLETGDGRDTRRITLLK